MIGAGWGWPGQGHRAHGVEIPFGEPRATGATGYGQTAEEGVMSIINSRSLLQWTNNESYCGYVQKAVYLNYD